MRAAVATILPDIDKLTQLTADNPVQVENVRKLRTAVETRLGQFAKDIDFVKRNDIAGGIALVREAGASDSVRRIGEVVTRDARRGRTAVRVAHGHRRPQPATGLRR